MVLYNLLYKKKKTQTCSGYFELIWNYVSGWDGDNGPHKSSLEVVTSLNRVLYASRKCKELQSFTELCIYTWNVMHARRQTNKHGDTHTQYPKRKTSKSFRLISNINFSWKIPHFFFYKCGLNLYINFLAVIICIKFFTHGSIDFIKPIEYTCRSARLRESMTKTQRTQSKPLILKVDKMPDS